MFSRNKAAGLITAASLCLFNAQSVLAEEVDTDQAILDRIESLESEIKELKTKKSRPVSSRKRENPFSFNGFISVGLSQHMRNEQDVVYENGQSNDLSFEPNTRIGFQVNAKIYEDAEVVYQTVIRADDDDGENYDLDTEWLYYKQNLGAGFNMQVGRIRFPAFMDSETLYVGNTYPWVSPPTDVYSVLPISNIDGVSVNHTASVGDWTFDTKVLLWGEAEIGALGSILNLENTRGIIEEFTWESLRFRIGYLYAEQTIDIDYADDDGYTQTSGSILDGLDCYCADPDFILQDLDYTFGDDLEYLTAALRYDDGLVYVSGEIVGIHTDKDALDESTNWNVTVGAYAGPVLLYIGYSETETKNESKLAEGITRDLEGLQIQTLGFNTNTFMYESQGRDVGLITQSFLVRNQKVQMAGLKYDFHPKVSLKFQAQYVSDFENENGTNSFGNFQLGTGIPDFESVMIYDLAIQAVF